MKQAPLAPPTSPPLPLASFRDWLLQHDEHAQHHLALIERVDRSLSGGADPDERSVLTEKLERWRYQHAQERLAEWTDDDDALLAAMERASRQLAGQPPCAPRNTFRAIHHLDTPGDAERRLLSALDEGLPLTELLHTARQVTEANFSAAGQRTMLLYAPLYVSNYCVNHCTYCGFRYPLDIVRRHLEPAEALEQIHLLRGRGFRHLLLVGGEYPQRTTTRYYADIARQMAAHQIVPAVEIAPQSTSSYAELVVAGVVGVTLYQETFNASRYADYHPRGPKTNYLWRLEGHDRAAEAGMQRLGLGILLGLADPVPELVSLVRHAAYLAQRFPQCCLAVSLPRLHEAPAGFEIAHTIADEDLLRYYAALRLALPTAQLVLSTREPAALRDRLASVCITQMSAGSSTCPGGYGDDQHASGEQFPVSDERSVEEVATMLAAMGTQVIWEPCSTAR